MDGPEPCQPRDLKKAINGQTAPVASHTTPQSLHTVPYPPHRTTKDGSTAFDERNKRADAVGADRRIPRGRSTQHGCS
jgi:hypothetical protein